MTNPSLYRDDSRVRHMLSALERISAMSEIIAAALPSEPTEPSANIADFL